jgi:hypothetical protein
MNGITLRVQQRKNGEKDKKTMKTSNAGFLIKTLDGSTSDLSFENKDDAVLICTSDQRTYIIQLQTDIRFMYQRFTRNCSVSMLSA